MSKRTSKQNNSLHLMFEELSSQLNDRGMYIGQVIRLDAPWSKERVKELIWKPTQKAMFNTSSTTELTTKEIDQVFTVIHKALAEKGIEIYFPSVDTILNEEYK